ncbi:hypothetical protein MMC18_006587 [Xylographa bjoerkii]|nr:hypothetical protein [Xylographa bjoerkii]
MHSSQHKFVPYEFFRTNPTFQLSDSFTKPEHEEIVANPVTRSHLPSVMSGNDSQALKNKSRLRMVKHNLPYQRASYVPSNTAPNESDVFSDKSMTHEQRSTMDDNPLRLDPLSVYNTASTSPNLLHYVPRDHNMDDTSFPIEATRGRDNHVDHQLLKQINYYVRAHPFIRQSLNVHTTTQRRTFERDIYDYARTVGLLKEQAKAEVRRARGFCGELDYDSDDSRLGDEVDDSASILSTILPAPVPSSNEVAGTEEAVERISMIIPGDLAGPIIGKGGVKINTIVRLSGSLVEIDNPENNSSERQITIIGLHKCNQVALDLLRAATHTAIGKKLQTSRTDTTPVSQDKTTIGTTTSTETAGTFSELSEAQKISKISKKRRVEDVELAPDLSTSATLKQDRRNKKTKMSRRAVTESELVPDELLDSRAKSQSPMRISHFEDSQTNSSRRNDPKHDTGDLARSPVSFDEATPTEEARVKMEKRKKKAERAEARAMDNSSKAKRPRHCRVADPISMIAGVSPVFNDEDTAVNAPANLTLSEKASSTVIESNRKTSAKRKRDRKSTEVCPKEPSARRDTRVDDASAAEFQLTQGEASNSKKKGGNTRLRKQSEKSAETPVEETKTKPARSNKRKESSTILKERIGVDGQPEVENIVPEKFARKSTKHHQVDIPLVAVHKKEEASEEEVRSEYFTPTKPKSKVPLPNSKEDSGVKTEETLSSKAKSSQKIRMEKKWISYYAELRRRSSLGPTIDAPLQDKVDAIVPVVAADISPHVIEAENGDPFKGETTKMNSTKQAAKTKKQNAKKSLPIGAKESNGVDENASPATPAISTQPTKVVEQDHGTFAVDSKTKPLAIKSSSKKKKKNREDSNNTDTTSTALICARNQNPSSGITMSNVAPGIDQGLTISDSPPPHGGWNPVNQAILDPKKVAGFIRSQPRCVAAGSEITASHGYADDPMELDQESWAVGGYLEACPLSSPEKASRKRKKATNAKKEGRESNGVMPPTKKSRVMKGEPGGSVDFSSPMIR